MSDAAPDDFYTMQITGPALEALLRRLNDGTIQSDGWIDDWRVEQWPGASIVKLVVTRRRPGG